MLGRTREQVLYRILERLPRPHRYTVWRWVVGVVATVGVALLPLTGTLRFDLWRGQHLVLGERVDLVTAAKAFAFPFLAVNILIILVSRSVGRYLCGFACPVGTLGRLVEWARFETRSWSHNVAGPLVAFLISWIMAAVAFSFWVDWRVFLEGSTLARVLAGVGLAVPALGLFGLIQFLGLRFCRDFCPSGVYFAVLGQKSGTGIQFDGHACTNCGVCDVVCPMDLHPRHLLDEAHLRGARGFYGEHMSNLAVCVRCGDCVVACEEVGTRGQITTALTMGFLEAGAVERATEEGRAEDARAAAEAAKDSDAAPAEEVARP